MFKVRHNWHKGRCAVTEMDISNSPPHPVVHEPPRQSSFWNEPVLAASTPLVQFDGKIIVVADKENGLRAWDIEKMENGRRKIVGARRFKTYEQGWRLGEPTALGIDCGGQTIDVVVGFESGGAMILQLSPSDDEAEQGLDFGFDVRFILPPSELPEKILHITYSHPHLLTLDVEHYLRAYLFESSSFHLNSPRPLATLHAQALHGPCNLTLRKSKSDEEASITAAIAYSMPLFHGGWSVGVQEVVLEVASPNGISRTRIGTSIPSTYQLAIHPDRPLAQVFSASVPVASPTSISYSHPYLLTSHRDNTLTLYLARSTDKEITIGNPRRLWGHTTGVARAGVAGRGRAVSVSQVGGEVRVWELESIAAAVAKADVEVADGAVVGIIESVRVENAAETVRVGKDLYRDTRIPTAVEWIGFDEEKVLVVTRDEERDKNVMLYDFTF